MKSGREKETHVMLCLVQRQGMARGKIRKDREKARQGRKNARQGDRWHSKARGEERESKGGVKGRMVLTRSA